MPAFARIPRLALPTLLALALFAARPAAASWPTQAATGGVPLCTAANAQYFLSSVPDGAGGAYFAWEDYRDGFGSQHVYLQHLDASGARLWADDGKPVTTVVARQESPQLVANGIGGVNIVWRDFRADTAGDVYAQRFNGAGDPQWGTDGVALCAIPLMHVRNLVAAADGWGGAIALWSDDRDPTTQRVYSARVDRWGAVPWTAGGVPVTTFAGETYWPTITSDGVRGVIVGWVQGPTNWHTYAQRVDTAGVGAWGPYGAQLCTDTGGQSAQVIAADGGGGAFVAWEDNRSQNSWQQIFAQHLAADGSRLWPDAGLSLSGTLYPMHDAHVVLDGTGGAFFGWNGFNNGVHHIFLQHCTSQGTTLWPGNGQQIATASDGANVFGLAAIADGAGGVLAAWDAATGPDYDVIAARVAPGGAVQWTSTLCSQPNWRRVQTLVPDGFGGAIAGWVDRRSGSYWDVYAGQIGGNGALGSASTTGVPPGGGRLAFASPPWPSPAHAGDVVAFALRASEPGAIRLSLCDAAGRRVRTLVVTADAAGPLTLRWDGRDERGREVAPGLYLAIASTPGGRAVERLVRLR
jgi:hypothetical protein